MEEEILRKPDLAQDKLHARMRQVSSEFFHQVRNCSSVCEHADLAQYKLHACVRRLWPCSSQTLEAPAMLI